MDLGGRACASASRSAVSRAGSSRAIELIPTFEAHIALHPHHRHIRRFPRSLQVGPSCLQATEARRASELTRLASAGSGCSWLLSPPVSVLSALISFWILVVSAYLSVPPDGVFTFALRSEITPADLISAAGELRELRGFGLLTLFLVWMRVDKAMVGVGIRI